MERVQRREVVLRRIGSLLFTIGPRQRRFIEDLDKANTGAFELVLTPLIFAGIGVWLSHVFCGGLVLPFVLGFIALGGTVYRLITDYNARMAKASEGKPWAK